MNILVLGATGMLGYSLFANLSEYSNFKVFGTVRNVVGKEHYFSMFGSQVIRKVDIFDFDSIESAIIKSKPDIVLNCIGLIKQSDIAKQHIESIEINALLPHQLAKLCGQHDAKLIHFSTDCVFDGQRGLYVEEDLPNAGDLYGRSKCLGEVDYGRHLTLRTSIIGHELVSNKSLIDWFLSQSGDVNGFSNAIFSGLPTAYVAKLLAELIIPNDDLFGLYHLSAEPIDKYTLLSIVSVVYGKKIMIHDSPDFRIDRSLDSALFKDKTKFISPSWQELIDFMHKDYLKRYTV